MTAVRLGAGYLELSVKYTDAMRQITDDLKGMQKNADSVSKSIDQGTRSSRRMGDEVRKSKRDLDDSRKSARDLDEQLEKSSKTAGKVGDELGKGIEKGTKRGQDTIGKAAVAAGKYYGQAISDGVTDGLRDAGVSSNTIDAGKKIGGMVLDGVKAGMKDAGIDIAEIIDDSVIGKSLNAIQDAFNAIKTGDLAEGIGVVAQGLKDIGQSGAGDALQNVADKVGPMQQTFNALKGDIKDTSEGLLTLAGNSGRISSSLEAIGAAAGPIGATVVAAQELDKALTQLGVAKYAEVPGSALWFMHQLGNGFSGVKDILGATPFSGPDPTQGVQSPVPSNPGVSVIPLPGSAPAVEPGYVAVPGSGADMAPFDLPKHSRGGVIDGPGTGTSDSIVAVDSNGVPVARVSAGEGVVKKRAMDRGAGVIVNALNNGQLPGFDDGTGPGGIPQPPIPVPAPQFAVPEATTGQAGEFNTWLQSQQGKAYQYGTLYDCSGFMSQVYNRLTGKQLPRFNTESDLAAYGFVRGTKPGTFQLGIHHGGGGPNSHMAGTLPDGRAVESSSNGVQIGAGAHGAMDPQFEDHWFLPGTEAMGGGGLTQLLGAGGGGGGQGGPDLAAAGDPSGSPLRTEGLIPAGAGAKGQSGSSLVSGALMMGAGVVDQVIDYAAQAAVQGISMAAAGAAAGGSMGAGAPAAPAAGAAAGSAANAVIGPLADIGKQGVNYGFQMAGIWADAIPEILLPFGVPRYFQTDPSQFMPKLPNMSAGQTTGEKAMGQGAQHQGTGGAPPGPGSPVQPGQLPGAQPVGAPVKQPSPQGSPGVVSIPNPQGLTPSKPWWGQGQQAPQQPPAGQPGPGVAPPDQGAQPQPQPQAQSQQGPAPVTSLPPWLAPMDVFDEGGWLQPGKLGLNMTNKPEPVLNSQQFANLAAVANRDPGQLDPTAGGTYAPDYRVIVENVTVKDVNELDRQLNDRRKLQMMRHAGRPSMGGA